MKALDHFLQHWRIGVAQRFVRDGDRLLDIGCYDRNLIDRVLPRIQMAVGVDVSVPSATDDRVEILCGSFPEDLNFDDAAFDCITILAVFEHVKDPKALAAECARILAPGGRVILTVPHPWVDTLLDILLFLRLADGMAAEEHHGFDVGRTQSIFETQGLPLHLDHRFQLGFNRLYVFEKPLAAP